MAFINKTIGIIGLGMLGAKIAERLLDQKLTINIYNRDQSKLKNFEKYKIRSFDSPCNLADECDIVIICVTNFPSLKEIFFNKQGLIECKKENLIVVDCSTISPDESIYCSKLLKENGIIYLSAPVLGGPTDAKNGELISIISGDKESFNKVNNIFEKLSKHIFYVGKDNGLASSLKIALNLNIAIISLALSEGIILSKHSGIDPEIFLKILNLSKFKTSISENKGQKMLNNDFSPSFYLKNMFKDLDLATKLSDSLQLSLPITKSAQQIFQKANNNENLKDKDYSAIFYYLNEYENKKI